MTAAAINAKSQIKQQLILTKTAPAVLDSAYTLIYIFTLLCPCLEAFHAYAAVSVARRCEVLQRRDRHRWAIFHHFSATMEPSKKMKTDDIKTIMRFIPIRVSVATKNTHTCLAARRTKPGVNRPTSWLFYNEKKAESSHEACTFISQPALFNKIFIRMGISQTLGCLFCWCCRLSQLPTKHFVLISHISTLLQG